MPQLPPSMQSIFLTLTKLSNVLCKGSHFAQAIRPRPNVTLPSSSTTAVDTGLSESLASTTEFLADCKGQLNAQVPRIAELRRKAIEDPLSFYEGERPGGADIPDDISIAASSRISTGCQSVHSLYRGKTAGGGQCRYAWYRCEQGLQARTAVERRRKEQEAGKERFMRKNTSSTA